MINQDCLRTVMAFLPWPDARIMSLVFRMDFNYAIRDKYGHAVVVRRTLKRFSAFRQIVTLFVERCIADVDYRSRYLFIHQTEEPHLCFRKIPKWLDKNPYRYHIRSFVRPEVEAMMHTYISTVLEISTI